MKIDRRKTRVCIYGGTHLEQTSQMFVSRLAYHVLDALGAVVVTGGFLHSIKYPDAISTDSAALRGAEEYARTHAVSLGDCYEAWIPDPTLDKRPDVKGVVRMDEDLGITVRRIKGRTALGRRLAMIAGIDILVTVSGKTHTEIAAEHALELTTPFLPIPSFGGDSKELLESYRGRIASRFARDAFEDCLKLIDQTIHQEPDVAARGVVECLKSAKTAKCLVLMPFDSEHEAIYRSAVQPAIENHMFPIRIDKLPGSNAILSNLVESVEKCTAVVADITTLNQNVIYELGYAHARGLATLIYSRSAIIPAKLPLYFAMHNVRVAIDSELAMLIDQHLGGLRRPAPPGDIVA